MERTLFTITLLLLLTGICRSEPVNNSASGGLLWSSGAGNTAETDESLDDHDEFDGGFPSLDGMLQWAIGINNAVF